MKFKESSKYHLTKSILEFKEGNFYIADTFVVGEIHEGAHINWDTAEKIIEAVYNHFGTRSIDISYISNRINNYSISPVDWYKFFVNKHTLKSISIVSYTPSGLAFFFLEKFFIKTALLKFDSLEMAIDSILAEGSEHLHTLENSSGEKRSNSSEGL